MGRGDHRREAGTWGVEASRPAQIGENNRGTGHPRRGADCSWSGLGECFRFSKAVSEALVRSDNSRYTIGLSKQGRDNRILIDYLRNNRTNTSVAAFSTRARSNAPVSIPVRWEDLNPRLAPGRFTLQTVPRYLRRCADPWAEYWIASQQISDDAFAAVASLAL